MTCGVFRSRAKLGFLGTQAYQHWFREGGQEWAMVFGFGTGAKQGSTQGPKYVAVGHPRAPSI